MANMIITFGTAPDDINYRDARYDVSETPENELTNGVQLIFVSNYGDDLYGAYVKVLAIDKEIGTKVYKAVWKTLTSDLFKQWYGVE